MAQLRQKIAQLLLRRSFAARERQRLAHKAQIGQGRQARRGACGGGQLRLQSRQRRPIIGRLPAGITLRHRMQPSFFIGGKHAVRPPLLRHHLGLGQHHLVGYAHKRTAIGIKRAPHLIVARNRLRLVIFGAHHRCRIQLRGQRRHHLCRSAVQHPQRHVFDAQSRLHFADALVNKAQAPIVGRQVIQNIAVKHKHRRQRPAKADGGLQGGVVKQAQIAAQPHQSDGQTHKLQAV